MNKKNLVVGLGNVLLCDDGIGIHMIRDLQRENSLENTDYLDLGTSSLDIGYYISEYVEKLVLIDSIRSDTDVPGTIYELGLEDLKNRKREKFSLHQLELIDSLKLASLSNNFPHTLILGIVPFDTESCSDIISPPLHREYKEVYCNIYNLIEKFISD